VKNWWVAVALGVVFGLLGSGAIYLASKPPRGEAIQLLPPPTLAPIQVHVTGGVLKPGVYALPPASRVQDALEAAGGVSPNADQANLNLAAQLQDGDKLEVPTQQPNAQTSSTGSSQKTDDQAAGESAPIININTATQGELETLPGVGPVTAQKIIAYRQTAGGFSTIEEIQKVSGIGPATFEKIKMYITVNE
jgi:competence protein ComEA